MLVCFAMGKISWRFQFCPYISFYKQINLPLLQTQALAELFHSDIYTLCLFFIWMESLWLLLPVCLFSCPFVYLLFFLATFYKHPCSNVQSQPNCWCQPVFKHVSVKEEKWDLVLIQETRSTSLIRWWCVVMHGYTWSCKGNRRGFTVRSNGERWLCQDNLEQSLA